MSQIFISYAREDRESAARLARALEARQLDVFWDRKIRTGKTWRAVIGEKLDLAKCLIVLWSKSSISSDWVIEEAETGKKRGILLPILIEQDIEPPYGFRSIQTADLSAWDGGEENETFQNLISEINEALRPATVKGTAQRLGNEWLGLGTPKVIKDNAQPRIFVSFAKQDRVAASAIADSLNEIGWSVYRSEPHFSGFSAWRATISKLILKCDVFIPLISAATLSPEGYLREEWKEAANAGKFDLLIFPVLIDTTKMEEVPVPDMFTMVQCEHLPGGRISEEFRARMQVLLRNWFKRNARLESK